MKDISPYSKHGTIYIVPDQERDDPLSQARLVESDAAPNLRDYWQVVRKHQWRVAGCLLGAVGIATVVILATTPIYTAKAKVLIERKGLQVVNIQQVLSESIESDEHGYYQTQYEMLRSRSLAAEVIRKLGLENNSVFAGTSSGFIQQLWSNVRFPWSDSSTPTRATPGNLLGVDSRLIDIYGQMLEIEPVKRSRLVNISVSTKDPALSAAIANAHANAYIHQGMKLRSRANDEAQKFLEGKLAELKERVQSSEEALNRFRRGKGIISLDNKENIVVDRLADLNKRLTEAEADRIGFESHARLIKQRDYDSLPAVINDPLIQNLKSQVITLEGQQANLAAQFRPGYPRLAQVQAQLAEAKQRLSQQIKNVVAGINSSYYASATKEKELRRQMEKQKFDALALKDASVEYAILAREANTNTQLYDGVLDRMKEIGVAAEIPGSNIAIVDAAESPPRPSQPQKRLTLVLAAMIGLMGGLAWAFLKEYFDDTLRTPEDIERHLQLANLVVVPDFFSLPEKAARQKRLFSVRAPALDSGICLPNKSLVTVDQPFTVITEAYRKLRTSILYAGPGQPPRTILFTSSTAGEGKTISVTNTAIMFAQLGYRCLVIDADLRRPFCHVALRVENDRGLADVLADQENFDGTIQATSIANLSVLSSGSALPNPAELVGSLKMRQTLTALRDRYDFILIDSPPVMPVSDAIVLSTMVDAVVYVVRARQTPHPVVKAALAQLRNESIKILGVLLNRVDLRSAEYKDYYEYNGGDYHSNMRLA